MAFNSEPPTIQTPQHPVAYLCMAHHAFEAVPERIFSAVPVQHLSALLCFLLTLLFLYLLIIADNNQLFPHVQNRQGEYIRLTSLVKNNHVETVVLLSHKKPDGYINVKVEFGEGEGKVPLDNIAKRAESYKPKERVTYKMIKEYIEAKYGFKVHTAYIAEVKRDLGLPMYDAPNAVEELKQPRKHPTAEKVEAIKDALKHFEVI